MDAKALLYLTLLSLVLGSAWGQNLTDYEDDEDADEDGRLIVLTTTGTTTGTTLFPFFNISLLNPLNKLGSLGNLGIGNITIGPLAALLTGLAIAGLTAATITLAVLLGVGAADGPFYDDFYDPTGFGGITGPGTGPFVTGPDYDAGSTFSTTYIKRALKEAARKYGRK